MVGLWRQRYIDHKTETFRKNSDHEYGRTVFSVEYSGRSDLFEGLKIWEDKKYRNLQGTYPVISLSFANVKEPTYELAEKKICELIAQLYVKYDFITESGKLRDTEVKLYKKS